ncbi:MAG: hypothetical protein V1835_02315 [Candidatus Micrarchaeota archaeon]
MKGNPWIERHLEEEFRNKNIPREIRWPYSLNDVQRHKRSLVNQLKQISIEKKELQKEIKKYHRNFKGLLLLGSVIMVGSIIFTSFNISFSFFFLKTGFVLNKDIWGPSFYLGLSIFSISFIFYQMIEERIVNLLVKRTEALFSGEGEIQRQQDLEDFATVFAKSVIEQKNYIIKNNNKIPKKIDWKIVGPNTHYLYSKGFLGKQINKR